MISYVNLVHPLWNNRQVLSYSQPQGWPCYKPS